MPMERTGHQHATAGMALILAMGLALTSLAVAVRQETGSATITRPAILSQAVVSCGFNTMTPLGGCPIAPKAYPEDRHWNGPEFEEEASWDLALSCTKDGPLPTLSGLSYGSGGQFAISLWFKQHKASDSHQFLYSHSEHPVPKPASATPPLKTRRAEDVVGPHSRGRSVPSLHITETHHSESFFTNNQVHAFIPGDTTSKVVRTLVRDDTDHSRSTAFLDSDGLVNNFDGIHNDPDLQQVKQGEWHHLVITTHPTPNTKGYAVYLDGAIASLSDVPSSVSGHAATSASGGNAMQFSDGSAIHLCEGADADPVTRFQGHLSHLRIFNASLSPEDITAVFLHDTLHMTPEGQRRLVVRHMSSAWARSALARQQEQDKLQADSHIPRRAMLDSDAAALPSAASLAAAVKGDSLVFSLLNGELTPGVLTHSGRWATMVTDAADAATSRNILAMPSCDRSASSGLPLPVSIAQPLPLTGFSLTAWTRLPRPGMSAWSTDTHGPLPLFSFIGTQQLGISPLRVDQTATVAPVLTRRLQQEITPTATQSINSPVYVPLSVHAYVASSTELGLAVIVAVINNAMTSLAQNKQLNPEVYTYTALINIAQVASAMPGPIGAVAWYNAAHHVAVVAAPTSTASATGQTTTTTAKDPLAYAVFIDGKQQATATLASVHSINGTTRRSLQDAASTATPQLQAWLTYRAQTTLATIASRGNAGLLLICGNTYGTTANMTQPASDANPAPDRKILEGIANPASLKTQPQVDTPVNTSDNSASTANTQPSFPVFELPPLLDPSESRQDALVTDVRIFPKTLDPSTVQALWAFGPGTAAGTSAQPADTDPASDPSQAGTPGSTADGPPTPDPSTTTVHTSAGPWVQFGSGFVPRGSSLDPNVQATQGFTPTDNSTDGNPQTGSSGVHHVDVILPEDQPGEGGGSGQAGQHFISTVLPEDQLGNSGGIGGGMLDAAPEQHDDNSRSVKLGLGLGMALGGVAMIAVAALLVYSWQRAQHANQETCIQLQASTGAHSSRDQALLVSYNPGQNSCGSASAATLLSPDFGSSGAATVRTGIKANCATFAAIILNGGGSVAKHLASLLPTVHSSTEEAGTSSDGPSTPPGTHAYTPRGGLKLGHVDADTASLAGAPSISGHTTIRMPSTTGTLMLPDDLCEPLAGLRADRTQHMPRVGILSPRRPSRTSGIATPGSPTLFKRSISNRPQSITGPSAPADDFVLAPSCLGRIMSGRSSKSGYMKAESDKSMILMPRNQTSIFNPSLLRHTAGGDSITPLASGSRASAANASASMTGATSGVAGAALRGQSMSGLPPADLVLPVTSRLSSFSGAMSGLAAIPEPNNSPASSHHRLYVPSHTPSSAKRGVMFTGGVAAQPQGTPRGRAAGQGTSSSGAGDPPGQQVRDAAEVSKPTMGTPASAGFRHRTAGSQPGVNPRTG